MEWNETFVSIGWCGSLPCSKWSEQKKKKKVFWSLFSFFFFLFFVCSPGLYTKEEYKDKWGIVLAQLVNHCWRKTAMSKLAMGNTCPPSHHSMDYRAGNLFLLIQLSASSTHDADVPISNVLHPILPVAFPIASPHHQAWTDEVPNQTGSSVPK